MNFINVSDFSLIDEIGVKYIIENLNELKNNYEMGSAICVDAFNGIKSKEPNSMHRLRLGIKDENTLVLSLERVTNTKLTGTKISKQAFLYIDINEVAVLANVLEDIMKNIYEFKIKKEIETSKLNADRYRHFS